MPVFKNKTSKLITVEWIDPLTNETYTEVVKVNKSAGVPAQQQITIKVEAETIQAHSGNFSVLSINDALEIETK
jgi:hypothetical protein